MNNLLPILFFVLGAVCMYALMKWTQHRRQQHKLKNAVTPNDAPEVATLQIKRDEKGRFVSLKQSRN
jgi:preprotein translocase subunit YajC